MDENIKNSLIEILIMIGFILILIGVGWMVFSINNTLTDKQIKCEENPRSCMSQGKLECIDADGIFYYGGNFSADNCVFLPK